MAEREPARAPEDDAEITPEVRMAFTIAIARIEKRRKINLLAYLIALVLMISGLVFGLAWMGYAGPGEFRGWILLVPFAATGLVLWLMGRWARRV